MTRIWAYLSILYVLSIVADKKYFPLIITLFIGALVIDFIVSFILNYFKITKEINRNNELDELITKLESLRGDLK